MPPPLDRETLKSLKRSDLQRICKDYGIKANLKTEALIDLLVDTTQARPRPIPSAQPARAPSGRTASRAVASGSRPRGMSSSSVIIHDTDEEDDAGERDHRESAPLPPSSEPEATPAPAPAPPPRTRRAKDTQYKLGVGRPTAVGGSGARAVTRSTSLSVKGKRVRGSRSVRPVEAAIQEEEGLYVLIPVLAPQAGPSGITHDHVDIASPVVATEVPPVLSPVPMPENSEGLKAFITDLISPIQAQVGMLQSEFQRRSLDEADARSLASQITSLRAEMETLRSQAALATQLQTEVQQLRLVVSSLMQQIPQGGSAMQPVTGTGKARESVPAGFTQMASGDPAYSVAASSHQPNAFPGVAQLLGKRHREMNDSQCSDLGDAEEQSTNDLDRRANRPIKKRPKLSKEGEGVTPPGTSANAEPTSDEPSAQGESQPVSRPPPATFTVFRGPEEPPESFIDPPPPTTHLSDLIPAPSGPSAQLQTPLFGGAIPRPIGSDENAPNHMPFNFSFNTSIFHPVTSTPYEMAQPALAYPEPPASPSPGVPSGGFIERAGGRIERNDLYHPHGRRHAANQAQAQGQDPSQPQSRPQSAASRPASRAATSQASNTQSQLNGTGGIPSTNGTVDPTALMGTPGALSAIPETSQEGSSTGSAGLSNGASAVPQSRRVASSSEIGLALGMSSTLALPPETPAPPMKRTMYGTELESDTRFGDFGVEGVATGFWAGLVPRF
ncbi:hypothetical protein FKP32DRAFT_1661692 [Trametes sanguinea]|nr:hypothetical protein FKP32DRAFT_1661692 [Trametes sanguinea]